MIPPASRLRFYLSYLPALCGLSGVLAFQAGCVFATGDTKSLEDSTASGHTACVGNCTIISQQISPQTIKDIEALGLTKAALNQFFNDLDRKNVLPKDLDHELRDIVKNYLDLKTKIAALSSEDPEITALIQQARQAVEAVNFPLAERLFNDASQRDVQAAQHLQQVATTRLISAAAAQAANGDLHMVQLNFVKAHAYYQKALELLPPSDRAHRRQYLMSLGNALREAGIRTSGPDIQNFLGEAVTAYREALKIRTQAQLPQDWARTQNNLGVALQEQGTRTDGEDGMQLLAEAVKAYCAGLTVLTHDQLPQDWAMTQNNLGVVLSEQGMRTSGDYRTQLLAKAVQAYREALTVYTHDHLPQQWAWTQHNLGATLHDQGTRTGGENGKALIREAIHAFELALEVRTQAALPVQWERTMGNLTIAKKALEDMK